MQIKINSLFPRAVRSSFKCWAFGLLGLSPFLLTAQAPSFDHEGTAMAVSGTDCHQLTADGVRGSAGAIWSTKKLDVTQSFTVSYQANFGAKDASGAEGMAFVWTTSPSVPLLGGSDHRLGFLGLGGPSVGIEFDTHLSPGFGDIGNDDHTSLVINSSISSPQVGPFPLLGGNIEDNVYHDIQISYDANTYLIEVRMDGLLQMQTNWDLSASLGNHLVTWGITASTGSRTNTHTVCGVQISGCDRSDFASYYPPEGLECDEMSINGLDVQYTRDCGYVIAGSQSGPDIGCPEFPVPALMKYDANGQYQWGISHFFSEGYYGEFNSVIELEDGGYFLGGWIKSESGEQFGVLVKTDAAGDVLWSREVAFADFPSEFHQVIEVQTAYYTKDDGLLLAVGYYHDWPLVVAYQPNGQLQYDWIYDITQFGGTSGDRAYAKAIDLHDAGDPNRRSAQVAAILVNMSGEEESKQGSFILRVQAETGRHSAAINGTALHYIPDVVGEDLKILDLNGDAVPDPGRYFVTGKKHTRDDCAAFMGLLDEFGGFFKVNSYYRDGACMELSSLVQLNNGNMLAAGFAQFSNTRDVLLLSTNPNLSTEEVKLIKREEEDVIGTALDVDPIEGTFALTGIANYSPSILNPKVPLLINQSWGQDLECQPEVIVDKEAIKLGDNVFFVIDDANLMGVVETSPYSFSLVTETYCEPEGGNGGLGYSKYRLSQPQESAHNHWNLYPNPVNAGDQLTLTLGENSSEVITYTITDQLGRRWTELSVGNVHHQAVQVDVPNLPSGTYFLTVVDGEVTKTMLFTVR